MPYRSRNKITLDNIDCKPLRAYDSPSIKVATEVNRVALTHRQYDVACALALENTTYKMIAKCLGISDRTVETYINSLRRIFKSETKSRLHFQLKHIKNNGGLTMSDEVVLELKPREIDLLKSLTQGIDKQSIAQSLEISIHTLEFYLQVLKLKFNCETENELIHIVKEKYQTEIR